VIYCKKGFGKKKEEYSQAGKNKSHLPVNKADGYKSDKKPYQGQLYVFF